MLGKFLLNTGLKIKPFFEPIEDASQVSLNLFGTIRLSRLELRPQAIEDLNLDLPIKIERGHFGNIEIELSLLKREIRVLVEDIYIFATLNTELAEDSPSPENRAKIVKKARLAADEAVRVAKKQIEEKVKEELGADEDKGKPAVAAIIASFIRGIDITISRVHIRIEDSFTRPECPVSLGVCISKVEIKKTPDNEEIKSEAWKGKLTLAQTSVKVEAVSVYLDSDLPDGSYNLLDRQFQTRAFANDIARDDNSEHRFLVHPLYVNVCAAVDCNGLLGGLPADRDRGVVAARVDIPAVKVSADPEQLVNLMGFGAFFGARETFIRHGRLRPKVYIKQDPSAENKRKWWRYAMALVREEVLKRAKPWKWAGIGMTDHQRQVDRREYAEIWQRFMDSEEKETKKALSGSEESRLREIEESERYTFEDIIFFRDFAENPVAANRRGDREITDKSGCLPSKKKKKKVARPAYPPRPPPRTGSGSLRAGSLRAGSFEPGALPPGEGDYWGEAYRGPERPASYERAPSVRSDPRRVHNPSSRMGSVAGDRPPRAGSVTFDERTRYAPTLAPTTMTARTNATTFTVSGLAPDRMPGMISFEVALHLVAVTLFKPPPRTPMTLQLTVAAEGEGPVPKSARLMGAPVPVNMPPRTPVLGVEVREIGARGSIRGRLGGAIGLIAAGVSVGGLFVLDRNPLRASTARPFVSTEPAERNAPTHDRDGLPLPRPDFVSADVKVWPPPSPSHPGGLVEASATVRTLRVTLSMELVVDLVNSMGPLMTVRPPPKVVYTKTNPRRQQKTARTVNEAVSEEFKRTFDEKPDPGQIDAESSAFVAVQLNRVEIGPIIVMVAEQPPVDRAAASGLVPAAPPAPRGSRKTAALLVWIERIEVEGQIINKDAFLKVIETRELLEREADAKAEGAYSKPIPADQVETATLLDPGVGELYTCFAVHIEGIGVDVLSNVQMWRAVMADRRPVHFLQPFSVDVGFWGGNAKENLYLKAVVHDLGIAVSPAKIRGALAVVNSLTAYVPLLQLPPPAPGPPPEAPPPGPGPTIRILAEVRTIGVQVLQDATVPNGYRMPLLRIGVALPVVQLMMAEGAIGLKAKVELQGKCWHPDTHVWETLIEPWDIEAVIKLVPGTYGNPTASIEAGTEKAFCINVNPAMIANLAAFGALAGALVTGAQAPLPKVDHLACLPAAVPALTMEDEDGHVAGRDVDLDDEGPPAAYQSHGLNPVPSDAASTMSSRYERYYINSDSQRYIPLAALQGDPSVIDGFARPRPAHSPHVKGDFNVGGGYEETASVLSGGQQQRRTGSSYTGGPSSAFDVAAPPGISSRYQPAARTPLVGMDSRAHVLRNRTGLPVAWRFVRGLVFAPDRRQDLECVPPHGDFRTTAPDQQAFIDRDEEEDNIAAAEAEQGDAFNDDTGRGRRYLVFYLRPPRVEKDGRWYPIQGRVPIGRPGLYVLHLPNIPSELSEASTQPILGATGAKQLVVDVTRLSDGGRTELILRAPIVIRNRTPISVEVRVRPTAEHRKMLQLEIEKRKSEAEQERLYKGGQPGPPAPPQPAKLEKVVATYNGEAMTKEGKAPVDEARRYSLSTAMEHGLGGAEWTAVLAPNVRGAVGPPGSDHEAPVPLLLASGEMQVRPYGSKLEWSPPETFFHMSRSGLAVPLWCPPSAGLAGKFPHNTGFCCYSKYSEETFLRQLGGGPIPDDPMIISLVPLMSIRSHLPFPALYRLSVGGDVRSEGRVEPGQKLAYMFTHNDLADLCISLKVDDPARYPQAAFSQPKHVAKHRGGASTFLKAPVVAGDLSLPIYLRTRDEKTRGKPRLLHTHTRKVTLFVPFWIVNRSGINLLAKDPAKTGDTSRADVGAVRLNATGAPAPPGMPAVELPDGNSSAFPLCTSAVSARQGDPYSGALALCVNEQNAQMSRSINVAGADDALYLAVPSYGGAGGVSGKGGPARVLEFGVRITASEPTRVIVIDARFMVVNKSAPAGLLIRQEGDTSLAVKPLGKEKTEVFQWPRQVPQNVKRRVQIALPPPGARRTATGDVEADAASLSGAIWSVPFSLEEADVFHLPLRVPGDAREKHIRVSIEKSGPCYYAFFDTETVPPVVVRNELPDRSSVLRVWQAGQNPGSGFALEQGAERPFLLEDPKGEKAVALVVEMELDGARVRREARVPVDRLGMVFLDKDMDPSSTVAALVAVVQPRGFQKLCRVCLERDPKKLRRAREGSAGSKLGGMAQLGGGGGPAPGEVDTRLQRVQKGDAMRAAQKLVQAKRSEAIAAAQRREAEGYGAPPPRSDSAGPEKPPPPPAAGASGAMEVELRATFPSVKVSVNSDNARELLLVSLEAIQAKVKASASKQEVEAIVKHFQIDQMFSRRPAYGVFIGPQHRPVVYKADTPPLQYKDIVKDTDAIPPKPMIYFSAVVLPPAGPEQANSDVLYLEEVTVELEPLDIRMHEDVLTELVSSYAIKLGRRLKSRINTISRQASENCRAGAALLTALRAAGSVDTRPTAATATAKRIYLEKLKVSKIRLKLTIKAGPAVAHELLVFSAAVRSAVEAVGTAILNIEKAPINLPEYESQVPLFGMPAKIAMEIIPFYIAAGTKAGLAVVGSMALNPWILVVGFFRGLKSFYTEATEGVGSGAEPEGGGAAAGGKACAVTWIRTGASWYSGVADAIGGAVDKLGSKHGLFSEDLRYYRNKVPMRAFKGLKQGSKMAAMRTGDAFFGLVQIPLEHTRRRGFSGIFTGPLAAFVNLFAQPFTGVIELNAKTFEGAGNSMSDDWHMHHDGRLRRARACGVRLSVTPFDEANSEAQENLVAYNLVRADRDVRMFDDRVICEHDAVYLTNDLLVYLNADAKSDSWTAPWEEVYQAQYVDERDTISSVEGVRVVLDARPPRIRFIPCRGENAKALAHAIQTKINAVVWGYRWTARFPDLRPPP